MFNPFSLKNKTILITGASSGIGRQCAIDCSKMGAKVILIARNKERLKETHSMMEGSNHGLFPIDLNNIDSIKFCIDDIINQYGRCDGVIHAAGIEITKPLKLLSSDDYDKIFRINTYSAFELIRQISGVKKMNPFSSIVLISSISALIGRTGLTAYSASKGALNSAVRIMALELASRKIRVNVVSPGTILTPMMKNYLDTLSPDEYNKRIEGFPLGLGNPCDISNACIYLLSDASQWVTGQNLIVDGGYTCK